MKITVEVMEQDIKSGKRGSQTGCPYALAIKRTFGRQGVRVAGHEDCQSIGHYWACSFDTEQGDGGRCKASVSFDLAKECGQKAEQFDRTGEMQPHSFEVEI